MKEKVQAPELRFDGFTDDWELRKLTNITSSYSGLTYSPTDIQDTGTFVLRSSNVKNDQLIDADNVYVNPDIVNSINVKVGDVIIVVRNGSRALIGKHAIVNEEMPDTVIGAFMSAFRGENGNYINALLSTDNFQKEVHKSLGATINQITGKDFSMMIFPTPKFGEQQKIGAFFKQLDYTIALHQRKLDLLKEQKKGYLQKMFPKNGAKVPELRFAGFADDWEERKLGELSNIMGGGTPSTSNPEYWDGDIDWYAPAEIGEQSYVSKSKKTITELGLKKSSARILPIGTVLFTSRAGIGNTAILAKEATTNQGFQSIVPDQNKLDSYFIFSRTNELKRYGEVTGAGSTFVEVSGKQMSKMSIMVPELSEQQKIGSFFKQLDKTIALHQRKLDLLKEQKKGYLQKMFPKNGAKVPELRFAGFTDAWELRKSKELCTISTGKGNTQDKVDDGAYPFYVRSATIEKSDEYLYDQEAILTVGDGVGTGKVYHYVNGKYNLHQRVYRMYDFKDVSAKYFYYYFSNNFYKRVMSMTAKTSVDSVRMEMIADMNIVFPSVKEQENIVELFSNLDNTIALHQRKLDLLKEQKKGYLQKMFV